MTDPESLQSCSCTACLAGPRCWSRGRAPRGRGIPRCTRPRCQAANPPTTTCSPAPASTIASPSRSSLRPHRGAGDRDRAQHGRAARPEDRRGPRPAGRRPAGLRAARACSWPRLRSLPHLFPIMPKILAGKPFLPSARTMRAGSAQHVARRRAGRVDPPVGPRLADGCSARLSMGAPSTKVRASEVTCPGAVRQSQDRTRTSRRGSRGASPSATAPNSRTIPALPHWIIAESLVDQVAPPVLDWLRRTVPTPPSGNAC